MLASDIIATYEGDPAAKNYDEIIFSYPGIFALMVYRVAHELHEQDADKRSEDSGDQTQKQAFFHNLSQNTPLAPAQRPQGSDLSRAFVNTATDYE